MIRNMGANLAAVLAIGSLWACSSVPQVSTEVENEVAARAVQGVAMDSVAIDSAKWTAWDATGALVAQGVTDSVGHFEGSLSKAPVGGLLVLVVAHGDTLRALVGLDTAVVKSRVATALVNVLTEAAVPGAVTDPSKGFPDSLVAVAARNGQKLLDSTMGVHLPWSEFAWDPTFKSVAPATNTTPAPLAGFLRAIAMRARQGGQTGPQWLDSLASQPPRPLSSDSLFSVELAGAMSALRLPQAQTTQFVQRLDSAAGQASNWSNAWLGQQIFPDQQVLANEIPWAVKPRNAKAWQRLVQVTGDSASAYDNRLAPQVRGMVSPGRSHEILAIAVGSMIAPDSLLQDSAKARNALDAYLVRTVSQTVLLLDQLRPEVWGMRPMPYSPSGAPGGSQSQPTDSGTQKPPPQDKVAQLVAWGLQSLFQPGWVYSDLQAQSDPATWMSSRFRAFASGSEARDTLGAVWTRHPELGLASPLR